MFTNQVLAAERPSDSVPPPSGARRVLSPPVSDSAMYATIDLPTPPVDIGELRVAVETGGASAITASLRSGQELVIGSGPEAAPVVGDPTVSARHCALIHRGHAVEVIDVGSRNGVRISGARVSQAQCGLGASMEIGRSVVRIDSPDEASDEGASTLRGLVGSSPSMKRLAASVRGIGALRVPVLLRGESGTGKDLVARALHDEGSRASMPFVVLNAATIRPELAESELFGHERGAFTGAIRERRGAFREAHKGTLFLDEIASLPLDVQAKLLRAVEQGTVRPLGAERDVRVDVRLIAATCEPLEDMVRQKRFRGDLYERLAVCFIRLPPLRDRLSDLPALARHLLATSEVGPTPIDESALAALRRHRFPGNVRELRNVLVQAALHAKGTILAEHVAAVLQTREVDGFARVSHERALQIFQETGFNVSAAARRAGLPRTTMRDLLVASGAPLGGVKRAVPRSQTLATLQT
ncbi:MAG: sigma 54-interacting transcriptional regulator [Polyangiaceae bacterium]|nr:sigma 54-interacting transcriptional regulator [Polyangiaceae bacterium]